ncbi:hypothetical protein [Fischerella sp. PCC 9605]|uniref:hypothetical protein n=1 Tax=Fischerella sp. PCC 9605 TaxID=1173024 RepID=UPI00047A7295|nr:hypothetical protein [Fischerella sp. PCC 9605]
MPGKKNSKYSHKMMLRAKLRSGAGIAAPALTVVGWLGMTFLPATAISASYGNEYSACASQLLRAGVTAEAASRSCAGALRPRDLSSCVAKIEGETDIAAVDALSTCGQSWRPEDVGTCVVGISQNTKEAVNKEVLNYCGVSLLPKRYAQCVVGLRSQIENLAPIQALNTCIDATDYISGFLPSFIPTNTGNTIFQPSFQTQPIPTNPSPGNTIPNNLNPSIPSPSNTIPNNLNPSNPNPSNPNNQ